MKKRPNIMLILADDLGYGDVGFNGCRDIPTPNLDSIASDGVRFSSGYSSHPFCSPMRAGLMACRYQQRFGYVANIAFDPHNQEMGIPKDQKTLATRLKKTGYRTGMVGKWHLGAASPFHPKNRGFDFFYGFLGGGHDYFTVDMTAQLNENYRAALDDNGTPVGLEGYLTEVLTDQALRFIRQRGPADSEPYFLYVAYNAPHTPLQAPEAKLEQFAAIKDKKRRTYAAMVSSMDDQVGRLLAEIESRGEREKTLVFFLSDNGGPERSNASDNGPLRGQKGDVYEGGIRVPFVMRWPGTVSPGTVYAHPVISLDASCTALAVAGAAQDPALDGVNLVPLVTSKESTPAHQALFWLTAGHQKWAVRSGDEKWVHVNGKQAVYELGQDLGETTDVTAQHEAQRDAMKAAFEKWDSQNQPNFIVPYREYHSRLQEFHRRMIQDQLEATVD